MQDKSREYFGSWLDASENMHFKDRYVISIWYTPQTPILYIPAHQYIATIQYQVTTEYSIVKSDTVVVIGAIILSSHQRK